MSSESCVSRPSRASSRVSTEAISLVSMLPPLRTRPTFSAGEARGIGHDRGEARGAGALDHRLLDRDQGRDRALELGFVDERDVVDEAADDFGGDLARRFDGDAFGQRIAARRQSAAMDGVVHRGIEPGLNAHDPQRRLDRFRGDGNAAESGRRRRSGRPAYRAPAPPSSISSPTVPCPAMTSGSS